MGGSRGDDTSDAATRYERVADQMGARVREVHDGAWGLPAPCEGWVARDVIDHLTEWLPAFFCATWDLDRPDLPPVDDDPAGAWAALDAWIRALLADPAVAGSERETPIGTATFEACLDTIGTSDVLIHTWDLARATGLDERLDPGEVRRMLEAVAAMGDVLVESGHYGPAVPVSADADEQTRLLALLGRRA